MKINELLFENAALHKLRLSLWKEFRDIGTKYGFTFVLSSGWPKVAKDGIWFGGGLKNNKDVDDMDLPIAMRKKGFIIDLTKKLSALMDEGHLIAIGTGSLRDEKNIIYAKDHLRKAIEIGMDWGAPGGIRTGDSMPSLVWKVIEKPGTEKQRAAVIEFTARYHIDKPRRGSYGMVDYGEARVSIGTVYTDTKENRKYWEARFKTIQDKWSAPGLNSTIDASNPEHHKLINAFLKYNPETTPEGIAKAEWPWVAMYFKPDKTKYADSVIMLPEHEFEKFIDENLL